MSGVLGTAGSNVIDVIGMLSLATTTVLVLTADVSLIIVLIGCVLDMVLTLSWVASEVTLSPDVCCEAAETTVVCLIACLLVD